MGIDCNLFKCTIPEELKCAICRDISYPPVKTKCDHLFCERCLQTWLINRHNTCPIDRCLLDQPNSFKRDTFIERMVGRFEVFCSNIKQGCAWSGEYSNLNDHLKKCPYTVINCPFSGCTMRLMRCDLKKHTEQCQFRTVECEYCFRAVAYNAVQVSLLLSV